MAEPPLTGWPPHLLRRTLATELPSRSCTDTGPRSDPLKGFKTELFRVGRGEEGRGSRVSLSEFMPSYPKTPRVPRALFGPPGCPRFPGHECPRGSKVTVATCSCPSPAMARAPPASLACFPPGLVPSLVLERWSPSPPARARCYPVHVTRRAPSSPPRVGITSEWHPPAGWPS